jgi:hypothetical protein
MLIQTAQPKGKLLSSGGGLFCVFASTGGWSKWGSWGLLEWYDQTEQEHPKFKAVIEWNRKNAKEK